MRRGAVSEGLNCGHRCQHGPQTRHGTSASRVARRKTRFRYLSAEQAALARQHVEPVERDVARRSLSSWSVRRGQNEPLASADAVPGMDGTGVPVRKEELVDRPGKTREVTLVTIWSAEGGPRKARPRATSTRAATRRDRKRGAPRKKRKKGLQVSRDKMARVAVTSENSVHVGSIGHCYVSIGNLDFRFDSVCCRCSRGFQSPPKNGEYTSLLRQI